MRDCSKNRAGFDRVLMAVAATFLTVSATSALAQSDPARNSAAELAIDAAVPRPEPANVPPPTVNDFKPDTTAATSGAPTASVPDAAKVTQGRRDQTIRCRPRSGRRRQQERHQQDRHQQGRRYRHERHRDHHRPPPRRLRLPPRQRRPPSPPRKPIKAASNVPPADQPVADKLRDMLGAKSLRYFERKAERAAVEKFYTARDFAPLWTQGGALTETGKGVIARLKDAASDGLNAADYPVPDFAAATNPDALAEAELKLTASMLDYARQAQSGRMHYSQVSGDIQYPEHPTDPSEVLANVTTAKDASAALDSYNPPQKLYRELKAKLAELRGQGDGPVVQIAERPGAEIHAGRAARSRPAVEMEDARVPQLRAKLGISRKRRRHPLRRQGRRGRAQIPARRRTQADRRARRQDRQGHQQPEARPARSTP